MPEVRIAAPSSVSFGKRLLLVLSPTAADDDGWKDDAERTSVRRMVVVTMIILFISPFLFSSCRFVRKIRYMYFDDPLRIPAWLLILDLFCRILRSQEKKEGGSALSLHFLWLMSACGG